MSDSTAGLEIRKSATQLFRYGLVGITHNVTGYLVYLLITYYGVEPKRAMTLLYAVGATIGYIGNRKWTFAHKGALHKSIVRYIIAHLFGYLVNLLMMLFFVDRLGYSHQWVQATAIFVVAGCLFITFKFFVFPKAVV